MRREPSTGEVTVADAGEPRQGEGVEPTSPTGSETCAREITSLALNGRFDAPLPLHSPRSVRSLGCQRPGFGVGLSGNRVFWTALLPSLVKRDVKGMPLVIPDVHKRLKQAIAPALDEHTACHCRESVPRRRPSQDLGTLARGGDADVEAPRADADPDEPSACAAAADHGVVRRAALSRGNCAREPV
jgi:hypothetical protein